MDGHGRSRKRSQKIMDILRNYRRSLGLTQADLAQRIKAKNSSTICLWERFGRMPSAQFVPKLAKVFGIPPGDFELMLSGKKSFPPTAPAASVEVSVN